MCWCLFTPRRNRQALVSPLILEVQFVGIKSQQEALAKNMRTLAFMVSCGVSFALALPLPCAADSAALFEKPLRETRAPLPRDPDNPQSKPILSCFYYPHFVVKQVDLGELGAEQLSIIPVPKGQTAPDCHRANVKNEMVIDARQWSGYFKGVKGDFAFFDADEGADNAMGFAVFNGLDGTKLFEDVTAGMRAVELTSPPSGVADTAAVKLSYRRTYQASCSLRADEKNCWSKIREATGLADLAPPDCAAAYKGAAAKDPSVIGYSVEVVLDLRHTAPRFTPTSKATGCHASD